MLRTLSISNFKAFSERQKIHLAPITLVFGPNSSGKTSIIQSLLLLKQTLENEEDPAVSLAPKGSVVDLGGYRELIFNHDLSRKLEIRLDVDSPARPTRLAAARQRALPEVLRGHSPIGVGVTFEYDAPRRNVEASEMAIYIAPSDAPFATFRLERETPALDSEMQGVVPPSVRVVGHSMRLSSVDWTHPYWQTIYARDGRREGRLLRQAYDALIAVQVEPKARNVDLYRALMSRAASRHLLYTTPDAVSMAAQLSVDELRDLRARYAVYTQKKAISDYRDENRAAQVAIRNFLPFDTGVGREASLRSAVVGGPRLHDLPAIAGFAGAAVRDVLMRLTYLGPLREYPERHYIFSGSRSVQVGKSGKMLPDVLYTNEALVQEVNVELERFGVTYELRVSAVVQDDPAFEDVFAMRLVDRGTGINVSIRDVGFGISQVLPVVAQSMLSRRSLICVEQPEIHLHPRLQAELADLLVRCTHQPRSNTFLIETHSEHMMLRLQHLVRSGEVSARDVSIVYVDPAPHATQAIQLRMDEDGEFLDSWPDGFFEEGLRELFGFGK